MPRRRRHEAARGLLRPRIRLLNKTKCLRPLGAKAKLIIWRYFSQSGGPTRDLASCPVTKYGICRFRTPALRLPTAPPSQNAPSDLWCVLDPSKFISSQFAGSPRNRCAERKCHGRGSLRVSRQSGPSLKLAVLLLLSYELHCISHDFIPRTKS